MLNHLPQPGPAPLPALAAGAATNDTIMQFWERYAPKSLELHQQLTAAVPRLGEALRLLDAARVRLYEAADDGWQRAGRPYEFASGHFAHEAAVERWYTDTLQVAAYDAAIAELQELRGKVLAGVHPTTGPVVPSLTHVTPPPPPGTPTAIAPPNRPAPTETATCGGPDA